MQKKLVEAVEGQAKSAVEEGRCKPDSWSKPEKSKYSGLSEELGEVSWKVGVINGSLVGCVCVLCRWSVVGVKIKDKHFRRMVKSLN